jgi:hypothetical protein
LRRLEILSARRRDPSKAVGLTTDVVPSRDSTTDVLIYVEAPATRLINQQLNARLLVFIKSGCPYAAALSRSRASRKRSERLDRVQIAADPPGVAEAFSARRFSTLTLRLPALHVSCTGEQCLVQLTTAGTFDRIVRSELRQNHREHERACDTHYTAEDDRRSDAQ